MKSDYKILIVDDHKIFREGLAFVISQIGGFEVAGEASNGYVFLEMIDSLKVDIVLMDISMPGMDGISATEKALQKYPDLKVIALTMYCDNEYYYKMIQAGVTGYLLKNSGKDELAKALNTVVTGEKYFSQKVLRNLILNSNNSKGSTILVPGNDIKLTFRESEILNMICMGLSNAEISEKLSISLRTLEGFKNDLMSKTGVKDSLSLAIFAAKNHLVDI